ncbi:hypothetical protein PTTG_27764, partial [Puccinia triticina 1-1 BBBD Race 1]
PEAAIGAACPSLTSLPPRSLAPAPTLRPSFEAFFRARLSPTPLPPLRALSGLPGSICVVCHIHCRRSCSCYHHCHRYCYHHHDRHRYCYRPHPPHHHPVVCPAVFLRR